jgi:hypothetical protein
MTMINWIEANWKDILIWSGVAVGVWNGLIAFLKVMGYPQLAAWCQKLEDAITAAIKAFFDSKKPPTAAITGIIFALFALYAPICHAQSESLTLGDVIQKAGATEGILYDAKAKRGLNFLATTIAEKGAYSLVFGLVSTDGIGLAANFDVGSTFPKVNFPVLSVVNYLKIGVGVYIRTMTVKTNSDQTTADDNKMGWGPTVFVKFNF